MKGITLFIFGGVAEMIEEPPSARDEFLIAEVEPISSFAMAAVFYGLNRIGEAAGWPTTLNGVMGYLGIINVILAVFKLVPAFPLDGGRILRAALWVWRGNLRWATRLASQFDERIFSISFHEDRTGRRPIKETTECPHSLRRTYSTVTSELLRGERRAGLQKPDSLIYSGILQEETINRKPKKQGGFHESNCRNRHRYV
jgi:hypothetical protein